jgi:ribosome biogenesis GTPase / thiamine phosphate phosphatase
VVSAHGRQLQVDTEHGRLLCVTRGKKAGVVCGDMVSVRPTAEGQGVVESVEPRLSLFFRADAYREKMIAANLTQVVAVTAPVPTFYEELLNRLLVAAETQGIGTVIVLNKADLPQASRLTENLRLYENLGYPLLALSARRGVEPLLPYLRGQISVLVGQSGVGKSTLLNRLVPAAEAATRGISRALDSGRHTTTATRMCELDGESFVIDSPGMQVFGLHHLEPEDLARAFVEFRPYLGHCRFRNCLHRAEPGCAVLDAAQAGEIAPVRMAAYHAVVSELIPAA